MTVGLAPWLVQSAQQASESCLRKQAQDVLDRVGKKTSALDTDEDVHVSAEQMTMIRDNHRLLRDLQLGRAEENRAHEQLLERAGLAVGVEGLYEHIAAEGRSRGQAYNAETGEASVDIESLMGTVYYRRIMDVIDRRLVNNLNRTASGDQRTLIQAAVNSILVQLYDGRTDDRLADRSSSTTPYDLYGKQICKHLGMEYDAPTLGVAFSCARQVGKTEALVMLTFAILVSVPGVKVIVLSTGKRISQMFANRLKSVVAAFPELSEVVEGNSERLVFSTSRQFTSPLASTIYFCPANATGLRGLEGDILIFDEMSSQPKEVALQFGFPLLKKYGRRAWIISTPGSGVNNLFNDIVQSDEDMGFKKIVFEGACRECARNAKFVKNDVMCPHRSVLQTPWDDQRAKDCLANIYKKAYGQLYFQEVLGAMVVTTLPAFDKEDIQAMFDTSRAFVRPSVNDWTPSEVFFAIDPSGGGERSETAVVSLFYTPDHVAVVSHAVGWVVIQNVAARTSSYGDLYLMSAGTSAALLRSA